MTTIDKPGIYQGFDEKAYHADPCPEPSLSRSIAKLAAEKTLRHAWHAHPRLNPQQEEETADKFDLGTAVHTALLTRGKRIIVGDYPDYKTNAAKDWRDAARKSGLVPILKAQGERVEAMHAAIMEQLPDHGLSHLFDPDQGRAEVVIAWLDPLAGWCRCMVDWLEGDLTITDIKTTSVDLDDESLGRHMAQMGYDFQFGFYERGILSLFPEMEGRVQFRFLFCEVDAPYAIRPVMLPNDAKARGRAGVERGMQRWAAAKARNDWPRYKSQGGDVVAFPPWSVAEYS